MSTSTSTSMTNKISSFAVFDLETNTLPDLNFNKANITEISIHGFSAEDVKNSKNSKSPRINHKLTLLFNPRSMIHPDSEKITGLDNDMLEHESSFNNNAANVIINFLKHLRQPVCLVAHNGNKFDFPILKYALSKLGLEVPSDIVCIDSLVAIKDLEMAQNAEEQDVLASIIPLPGSDLNLETKELTTPLKIEEISEQYKDDASIKPSETSIENESPTDWQKLNETTPRRPPNLDNISKKHKRLATPEESLPFSPQPKSRRSLFAPTLTKAGHNKLGTIYERLFGDPPELAHHAEADVVTLEKIMLYFGKSFVDYAEKNAKSFSEVKKLGAR